MHFRCSPKDFGPKKSPQNSGLKVASLCRQKGGPKFWTFFWTILKTGPKKSPRSRLSKNQSISVCNFFAMAKLPKITENRVIQHLHNFITYKGWVFQFITVNYKNMQSQSQMKKTRPRVRPDFEKWTKIFVQNSKTDERPENEFVIFRTLP